MALIATGERGAPGSPVVAGRSVVLRQFDFARACGVERVIGYGNGAPGDADALRHAAERAKIAHAAIASAHALIALVDWSDELLVIQPGLLPEAGAAIEALGDRQASAGKVLTFAAARVPQIGLERVDADAFWAGALLIPGALVDRLEQLPEDADPHAALLRIALQSHLPGEPLPPDLLADRRWALVRSDGEAAMLGAARMRRVAASGPLAPPSRRLVELALTRFAVPLNERRIAPSAAVALAGLALASGLIAAWYGYPAGAFGAIALAVPLLHGARLLDRLGRAAFERSRLPRWLERLPDAALLVAGALTLAGPWYRQLFPPLVLLAALQMLVPRTIWRVVAGDRAAGSLVLAIAGLFGLHETALMAWALLALAAGPLSPRQPPAAGE